MWQQLHSSKLLQLCGLNHIVGQMHKNCQVVICYWVTQHSQFNLQQWWCLLGKYMVTVWCCVCMRVSSALISWCVLQTLLAYSSSGYGILDKGHNQIYQVKQHFCPLRCKKETLVGNGLWKMRWNQEQVWGGVVACTIKMLWLVVCVDPYLLDKLQIFLAPFSCPGIRRTSVWAWRKFWT